MNLSEGGGNVSSGVRNLFVASVVSLPLMISVLFSVSDSQEKSLTVLTEGSKPRTISFITVNAVVCLPLNELAPILGFTTQDVARPRSFEFRSHARRITFVAENPFVVINDAASTKALSAQLPSAAIILNNAWYLSAGALASTSEAIFGMNCTYDAIHTLRFSKPKLRFDIPSVTIETKVNGSLIRIVTTKPIPQYEHFLKKDGWLYVTIPNVKGDVTAINRMVLSNPVKKIVAIQSKQSLQLTFKLDKKILSTDISVDPLSNDLLISLRGTGDDISAITEERRRSALAEQRKKYGLDVIVLDAGHGGKDPGTIGVTGTKEKDVALAIVLKLGRLIKKELKSVKVVYTRDDDTFIELDRRGQIANAANGKLFISVHCNSMPRKPYPRRGFEVYLLRPGRTDEAISIAERENSVIELEEGYERRYKRLTDENFILVTMAQSAHMKASEMFAELASKEMDKELTIPNNGVTQAGFLVLVGSAMPNVLIETAYLSNREDEKLLKSKSGQDQYAEAIFRAIKRYKEEYEKFLQEGNEFGEK